MATIQTAEIMKKLNARFLDERGFSFEYFHEKGGDSACVYICRFRIDTYVAVFSRLTYCQRDF